MKNVKYISASAGSGKTYTLTKALTEAVKNKEVEPENVILTTFTKAAAAEFKAKTKAMFYENGLLEQADRLDQALIGTIHSVAEAMIVKYWYELGISPQINPMSEETQQFYKTQSMVNLLDEEEQNFINDFSKEFSLPDWEFWKGDLSKITDYATNYGITDFTNSINYSKTVTKKFLHGGHHIKVNIDALSDLLDKAEQLNEATESDEQEELRALINEQRQYLNRRDVSSFSYAKEVLEFLDRINCKELEESVKAVADGLNNLYATEEVYQKVDAYIDWIFNIAQKWSGIYKDYKKENHLIDFNDMEQMFYELLQKEEVAADIKATYKYVFVDEFQDCSPMQVKIFDKISQIVEHNIWVGDKKQAIYSFRGSDTELTESVMNIVEENEKNDLDGCSTDILGNSWRSVPEVVDFTNAVYEKVFDKTTDKEKNEVHLEPQRKEHGKVGFWWLTGGNTEERAINIAANIIELLRKDAKPNEIAILARNKDHFKKVAEILREHGVPIYVNEDELSGAYTVRLVTAILQLIEDGAAEYPKAHIAFLTEPNHKLGTLIDDKLEFNSKDDKREGFYDDIPLVKKVLEVREHYKIQPISAMVQGLIIELDLFNVAKKLNDAADSDKLLHAIIDSAAAYEDNCAIMNLPSSITGFIEYINQNQISVSGAAEGVQFYTFHKSKGLEWKTVVVLSCDYDFLNEHRFLQREYFGVDFVRLATPSKENLFPEVVISVLPNIFGLKKAADEWLAPIRETERYSFHKIKLIEETKRLFYVAMTRPRDNLILALNGKGRNPKPLDAFTKMGFQFNCDYSGKACDLFDVGIQVERLPNADIDIEYSQDAPKNLGVKLAGKPEKNALPRDLQPSSMEGGDVEAQVVEAGTAISVKGEFDSAVLGTCVHDIFCVAENKSDKEIEAMVKAYGFESNLADGVEIKKSWNALTAYLTNSYGAAIKQYHELPFKHQLKSGQIVTGSMDFVWETPSGYVIVDYKTFPGKKEALLDSKSDWYVGKYKGQLDCYEQALAACGKKVVDRLLYYPMVGVIIKTAAKGNCIL